MARLTMVGSVALLLAGLGGCGPRSAEANLKKQIDLMRAMSEKQAKVANPREIDVEQMLGTLQQLVRLQEQFERFPEAEKKAAREKYAAELKELGLDPEAKNDANDDAKDDDDDMPEKPAGTKEAPKKAAPAKPDAKQQPAPAKEEPKYTED